MLRNTLSDKFKKKTYFLISPIEKEKGNTLIQKGASKEFGHHNPFFNFNLKFDSEGDRLIW